MTNLTANKSLLLLCLFVFVFVCMFVCVLSSFEERTAESRPIQENIKEKNWSSTPTVLQRPEGEAFFKNLHE